MTRAASAMIANAAAETASDIMRPAQTIVEGGATLPMQMSGDINPIPVPHTPEAILAALTPEQRAEVDKELKDSRTIQAVKAIRTYTRCGLKEAVDTIRHLGYMGGPLTTHTPAPVEPPAQPMPELDMGSRLVFKNRPTKSHKSGSYKQTGTWEIIGTDGKVVQFQKVRADGAGLIPRKTTSIPVADIDNDIRAGYIVPA